MIFSPGDSPLNVLLGRGDGTFAAPVSYLTAPASRSLTVADVNGDCILDLVTSADWRSATAGGSIGVLLGIGDGTFQPAVRYGQYRWGYFAVTTTDVNDDGHLDLVASGASGRGFGQLGDGLSRGVAVLLNNRDGTFGVPTFYDHSGRGLAGIATADFNGDFSPDILTSNFDDDTFSILYGQRSVSGALRSGSAFAALAGLSAPALSDLHGAGMLQDGVVVPGAGSFLDEPHAVVPSCATSSTLTDDLLGPLVAEAVARFAAVRVPQSLLDAARQVTFHVNDLPGLDLGLASLTTVTIDRDAAGFGWFIDPTPSDSREFLYDESLRTLRPDDPRRCRPDGPSHRRRT